MCTSDNLLAISHQRDVAAYTLIGGGLKWKVSGKLPGKEHQIYPSGLAADDQGLLFVCDVKNKCVYMLYARDGAYLGVVVRKGEQGLNIPSDIAWHKESASLVIANYVKGECFSLRIFARQDCNASLVVYPPVSLRV